MSRFFNYLKRNKVQSILVMGLSIISLFLCLIALTNTFVLKAQIRDLQNIFQTDMDKIRVIDFSYVKDEDEFGYDIDEIKNTVRKDYGLMCGAYAESYIWFEELRNNEDYLECNREEYKGTFYEEDLDVSDVIMVDPEIMDIVDCGIHKEDLLTITIDEELYYPIYVGTEFKNIIKIDDVLTGYTFGTRYIVKGYIEDTNWFSYYDPFEFPASSMKHKFITTFCEEEQTDSMTQLSTVSQIFIKGDASQDSLIRQIENLASQKDIKICISTVEEKMQQLQADNSEIIRNEYGFAVVVMICSMISIGSLFCAFILIQIKEYGIRLAFGESKERLMCILAGKHLIRIAVAMLIAIWLTKKYFAVTVLGEFSQLYYKSLAEYAVPITILVSVLYTLISLIPPIIMLNRMELVQLVKKENV